MRFPYPTWLTRSGKRWPRRSKACGSAAPGGTSRSTAVTSAAMFSPATKRRIARIGVWRRTGAPGRRGDPGARATSLGGTLPAVFESEDAAASFIKARVDRASTVPADESPAWNALHARFDTRRINHSVEYATDEACTNQAESYFARLRRGERGHHHRISGVYLVRSLRAGKRSVIMPLSVPQCVMSAMPPAPVLQPV